MNYPARSIWFERLLDGSAILCAWVYISGLDYDFDVERKTLSLTGYTVHDLYVELCSRLTWWYLSLPSGDESLFRITNQNDVQYEESIFDELDRYIDASSKREAYWAIEDHPGLSYERKSDEKFLANLTPTSIADLRFLFSRKWRRALFIDARRSGRNLYCQHDEGYIIFSPPPDNALIARVCRDLNLEIVSNDASRWFAAAVAEDLRSQKESGVRARPF